jgi:hypothetical protein
MVLSSSHDASIDDGDFIKLAANWTKFVDMDIEVWKEFHEFYLKSKIPVHIVRYEDLLTQPQ